MWSVILKIDNHQEHKPNLFEKCCEFTSPALFVSFYEWMICAKISKPINPMVVLDNFYKLNCFFVNFFACFHYVLVLLLGQTIFWPKNWNFWLYNLQILTLLWPINFLRLQLQNNSALGVVANSESYSYPILGNLKKNWLFDFRDDILICI